MEYPVVFDDLSYWYPDSKKPALYDINLRVRAGEFFLVVGSSGSGKSTLLKCINGLVPHFSGGRLKGRCMVCGLDTRRSKTKNLARFVGFVFQDPESQFIMSTVENEMVFGLENLGLERGEIEARVKEVSEYLGLGSLMHRRVSGLSGGEKQKVVFASVLAMRPNVVVLDEPTSQLDPATSNEFLNFLKRLNRDFSLTVILAEHRIERILPFVDRVFDLDSFFVGVPEDILPNSVNKPPIIALSERLREKNMNIGTPLSIDEAKTEIRRQKISLKIKHIKKPEKDKEVVASIQSLSKSFNGKKVLENININLYRGEFTALMGRNGAGKTTLVKHLNGLLKLDEGSIRILNEDIRNKSVGEMAHLVGFVSQNPNDYLFSETVLDELNFTAKNLNVQANTDEILSLVGLTQHKNAYPRDLSGGERQKVALASILVGNPELIVFDEPTRGMDAEGKRQLVCFLKKLCSLGKTILLVTHDVETVAVSAERVILVEGGTVIADGPSRDVLNNHEVFAPQISRIFPGKNYLTVEDVLEGLS